MVPTKPATRCDPPFATCWAKGSPAFPEPSRCRDAPRKTTMAFYSNGTRSGWGSGVYRGIVRGCGVYHVIVRGNERKGLSSATVANRPSLDSRRSPVDLAARRRIP